MVWSLIRYSPAWRIAGWASLIYAADWLILSQGADKGGTQVSAPIMIFMGYMVAITRTPETASRCTFFDAALPVEGRQLWVSKMITLVGMVWLPAPGGIHRGIHRRARPCSALAECSRWLYRDSAGSAVFPDSRIPRAAESLGELAHCRRDAHDRDRRGCPEFRDAGAGRIPSREHRVFSIGLEPRATVFRSGSRTAERRKADPANC